MRLAFIGGGNMSTALVGGLLARGAAAAELSVADPSVAQLDRLRREFGVHATTDNVAAVRDADLVVLAVKPQDMATVARGLAEEFAARRRIVVSVAAGIRVSPTSSPRGAGSSCRLRRASGSKASQAGSAGAARSCGRCRTGRR